MGPSPPHTFILLPFLPNDYNWMIPGLSLQRVFQKNIQREAGSRVPQLTFQRYGLDLQTQFSEALNKKSFTLF